MKDRKRPLIFKVKWKDFYILWVWKIALIWITKAEHTNPKNISRYGMENLQERWYLEAMESV